MHRFTLRQLEYLIACVDHGSIAAAAEAVSVSQPTISVAITKLEQQFGSQLLIRQHAQGVIPTTTAKNILPNARILLNQADELQHDAMTANEIVSGTIRLGSFITLAPVILPNLIKKLMKVYYMYVSVRDNNVDQALRVLKKKMQREGMFREMKNRRAYEKPSERRAREMAESTRRVRKLMRKRLEREGY